MICCTKLEDYTGTRSHRVSQDPLLIFQEQAAPTLLWAAGLVPGFVLLSLSADGIMSFSCSQVSQKRNLNLSETA